MKGRGEGILIKESRSKKQQACWTNLRNSKGRTPLFLQDVQANAPIAVNVRVKNLCPERYLQYIP